MSDRGSTNLPPAPVYLDSASSEPLHPAAREVLLAALDQGYADPRRLHGPGRSARLLLDNAREATAGALGVRADEVTFTSSGTDAVHRGLLGLARGRARIGRLGLLGAVEHSSVLHAWAWSGQPEARIPVTQEGTVTAGALRELLEDTTAGGEPAGLVAVQAANHEVGTRQPVAELAAVAGEYDVPLFCDAAAAAGRERLPGGWAVAAASAHKWGGPAGVGVLLVRKGARWRPVFPADDRADERATGFENVPAALAAAAALQAMVEERDATDERQRRLVARLRAEVPRLVPDVEVVGDPEDRLGHLLTFSCLYVDGEALVGELDRHGFGIASGSACTASTLAPSHVLAAMGVLTHGNVRLSLTRETTEADVDRFLAVLPSVVAGIRERAGIPR